MTPRQQKMMRYMPLMFLVFLYNYSAGLALYWTVHKTCLTILQTKLIRTGPNPANRFGMTPGAKKAEIMARHAP